MKKLSKFTAAIISIIVFTMGVCQISYGAEMTYKNGMLEVSGLDSTAKAICASYDSNKVLTGVKITDVTNGMNNLNAKTGDRIFLWENLVGIKPLHDVITVDNTDTNTNNILIVYFSRAGENWQVGNVEKGNTAVIADYIKEKVDADVFEISPVNPYPEDYMETVNIARDEKNNNSRPEFKGEIKNFEQYDTVFLGYPIWNGGLPMIMYTFLEEYNMSGKTVIPFSTHGGSGWGNTKSELNTLCPNAEFKDGYSTAGTNVREVQTQDAVHKWVDGLELNMNTNNDEQEILAVLNARCKAMVDRDIDTLDALMDDNITLTHMTGVKQTKWEWLDDIANGDLRYDSIEIVDPVVEIDGDRATVKHTSIIAANAYGSYSDSWRLQGNSSYVKRNGKWIWC